MTQQPTKPKVEKWREKVTKICEDYWMTELGIADGGEYPLLKKLIPEIQSLLKKAVEEIKLRKLKESAATPQEMRDRVDFKWVLFQEGYNQAISDLEAKKKEVLLKIKGGGSEKISINVQRRS